jgi:hypothetical protein
MIRLRGAHRNDRAVVILGGPSLVACGFDFATLQNRGFVTFADTKALTPHLLGTGFAPDYYLMLFPERAKDNALQTFVYRSLLAGSSIEPFLRRPYRRVAKAMREAFHLYFEPWRPERGPHKRYRWKPDVYLPDSPYDLLQRIPGARIIANRTLLNQYFPAYPHADRTCFFDQAGGEGGFDLERYFNPVEDGDRILVWYGGTFLNSAAIVLYPLLRYMGFREVYFLGMDMSMLGTLEYAAPYTFRSMAHFWWFFRRTRHVFNANYKTNGWFFKRPKSEFDDLRALWRDAPVAFTRVYDPWRYATPVEGIRTMSVNQFMQV